jgi:hypothetical protein
LFERIDRLELQVEELKKRTGYMVRTDQEKDERHEQPQPEQSQLIPPLRVTKETPRE